MTRPFVIIEIDADSRLGVQFDPGVHVGLIDRRIDPHLVLLPTTRALNLEGIVATLTMVTFGHDDLAHTGDDMLNRLARREIIVAEVAI